MLNLGKLISHYAPLLYSVYKNLMQQCESENARFFYFSVGGVYCMNATFQSTDAIKLQKLELY